MNALLGLNLHPAFVTAGLTVVGFLLGLLTTPYMGAAGFAYALMTFGLFLRKRSRQWHRSLMAAAMTLDLGLVATLEIFRGAVDEVFSGNLNGWQMAHVVASTLAVALYGPMIYFGQKLWKGGKESHRNWHLGLGLLTFCLRSLGFLLMFSLLQRTVAA